MASKKSKKLFTNKELVKADKALDNLFHLAGILVEIMGPTQQKQLRKDVQVLDDLFMKLWDSQEA